MINLLDKIQSLRRAHHWSEYELSLQSGVPQTTISAWRKKQQIPSLYSLEKICTAFDISLSALLADENEPLALTANDREFLQQLHLLTPAQQISFLQLLESFFQNHPG